MILSLLTTIQLIFIKKEKLKKEKENCRKRL